MPDTERYYWQSYRIYSTNLTTGTWTETQSTTNYFAKTATDETSTLYFNIIPPVCTAPGGNKYGVQLESIHIPMRIATADLDAVLAGTLTRYEPWRALTDGTVNVGATSIPITEAGTQVTFAATDRMYIATITTPAPSATSASTAENVSYNFSLSINAGATSVIRIYTTPFAKFRLLD